MCGAGNYIVDDDAVERISPVSLQSAGCKCHTPLFNILTVENSNKCSDAPVCIVIDSRKIMNVLGSEDDDQ